MSEVNDRMGGFRVEGALYDQWLRRCHREGVCPDDAAGIQLQRALRREGSIVGEDEEPVQAETPEEPDETERKP